MSVRCLADVSLCETGIVCCAWEDRVFEGVWSGDREGGFGVGRRCVGLAEMWLRLLDWMSAVGVFSWVVGVVVACMS